MEIIISNSSGKPIYEQITDQVKSQIMSGQLKAGDPLIKVDREKAAMLKSRQKEKNW